MKKLIGLFAVFCLLIGIWITVYGLMGAHLQSLEGISCAISGSIIFGFSLIGLIFLVKDSKL